MKLRNFIIKDFLDYRYAEKFINQDRKNYLCFEMLRAYYNNDNEFRKLVDDGVRTGKVAGFPEELWQAIDNQNIRGLKSFEDVFRDGYNIGGPTVVSRQLSYSFPSCTLCSGVLPMISGTKNSEMGECSWMVSDGNIYDTSLMLIIDKTYANKFGYQYEYEYNPHNDPIYCATYEFTNNQELRGAKKR